MDLKQKTYLESVKGDKLVQVVVEQDMPLGLLFDALMEIKGYVVERMVNVQKAEQDEAVQMMGSSEPKGD